MTSRDQALERDSVDPLREFRDRFAITDPDVIYVDGNSLGRLPFAAQERVQQRIDEWARELVTAWKRWIDLPTEIGDLIAEAALGARAGEVLVADSTTVNLYKLVVAALEIQPPGRGLMMDTADFPTDRYVLQGIARQRGIGLHYLESDPIDGPSAADVRHACTETSPAVLVLSHVHYRSAALADLDGITRAARETGTVVVWDLSHSVGAVPIDLRRARAELAVGCTYKYLNAGPGAPAFLYVGSELQERLRSPIWGWFGQADQFEMGRTYDPQPGIRRFLAGTPSILPLVCVEAGVELVAEAGLSEIRAKGTALTEFTIALSDERLASLGFAVRTPRDPRRRGAHVSLQHADAWQICQALIDRGGVIPDFRPPQVIRIGLPPLYTRYVDVWDAIDRIAAIVSKGVQRGYDPAPGRIT